MSSASVRVSGRRVLAFGATLTAGMLVLHSVVFVIGHRTGHWNTGLLERVNLGEDLAAPTWVASTVLLACAVAAVLVGRSADARGITRRGHWYGMAALFALASLDEIARLHEWMGDAPLLRGRSGLLHYGWVLAGIALLGVCFVIYLPFLVRLDARTRALMVAAAAVYFGGALVIEMLNARTADAISEDTLRYALQTGVEESFEFLGAFLFLFTLLDLLERHRQEVVLTFGTTPTGAAAEPADALVV